MSADRQENHDMTHRDITLLLADAADDVEIGMAPVQAVVRGGRRRRTRRWAVAAATAVLVAGSTVSLAMTGLQDGDGKRGAPVATQPPTAEERDVTKAQRTLLAVGTDQGKEWKVFVDVWAAPRNDAEAREQLAAMTEHGKNPLSVRQASDLIGMSQYTILRSLGDSEPKERESSYVEPLSGTEIEYGATQLNPDSDDPQRLVIGDVAKTAQRVTCTWKDGTTTEVRRVAQGYDVNSDEQVIRPAAGSPVNWFVCLAPEGTAFKSAKVTE